MKSIQERILQVLEKKGITAYRICKDLGLSMGYFDKRGAIGTDKYLKIIEYLADINPHWLLTGEGPMLRDAPVPAPETPDAPCADRLADCREEVARLHERLAEALEAVNRLAEKV